MEKQGLFFQTRLLPTQVMASQGFGLRMSSTASFIHGFLKVRPSFSAVRLWCWSSRKRKMCPSRMYAYCILRPNVRYSTRSERKTSFIRPFVSSFQYALHERLFKDFRRFPFTERGFSTFVHERCPFFPEFDINSSPFHQFCFAAFKRRRSSITSEAGKSAVGKLSNHS